jgi:DNA-directed RNA polymerase subunit RPC12/RpoP
MTVFICEICSKEFVSKQALGGHKSAAHKNGSRYSHKRKLTQKCHVYQCQFCGKETTNPGANKAHENRCLDNPNPSKVIREKNLSIRDQINTQKQKN